MSLLEAPKSDPDTRLLQAVNLFKQVKKDQDAWPCSVPIALQKD